MAAGPELVPSTIEHAGDDPHPVLTESHHGQVGVESTIGGQPRGVDGAADRHVHLVDGQAVGVLDGSRTFQLVDLEGAEVHHTAVLAQVEVLTDGDGAPPAVIPFHIPLGQVVALYQVGVGSEPLRALPGSSLEEHGVQVLLTGEVGANSQVPAAFPLLVRVDNAVRLVEVLLGPGPDVLLGPLLVVEARDVGTVDVDDTGIAKGHPLGDHLSHAWSLLDPHRGG